MKEFEKWYKETYPNYPPGINPNSFVFHKAVCGGWKAALEWQKAECIKMDEHHTIHCNVYCSCYNNVLDTIEEELDGVEE